MITTIRSQSEEVAVSRSAPFTIIGEKINPTGRRKLAASLREEHYDYALELARIQVDAGADILDVNVGASGLDEARVLPQVIRLLAAEFDVPLCIDSANSDALEAGLAAAAGKPLVNSVNGEERSLQAILPLVKERGAAVIGLTMDDDGIPNDATRRIAIAGKILERAAKAGIPAEDVIIDPLVLTVGADDQAGAVTLQTITAIREAFGVNINIGASNISFGLPDRHVINQAFLGLAISAGATCAITDPVKLASTLRAIDLILGRDAYAGRYIKNYRNRAAEGDG